MKLRLMLLLLVLIASSSIPQAQNTLVVFAAASLSDAFTEIAETFQAENPNIQIIFNFGSSATLAAQLVEGAPADIFASANDSQMNHAREAGRIAGQPQTFAKNRLVLLVPADNPANIQSLSDLANAGVQLVVAAEGVPVRDYTNTMLERLAADPAFGENYRAAFMANIVSEEDNVRQVAAKVALGEADAGIVYVSDVTPDIANTVLSINIPDYLNSIATYPIAISNDSAQAENAQAFIDFVLSDAGQAILVAWNFISVRIPETPDSISLPEAGILTVDGQVLNPLSLNFEALQSQFTRQSSSAGQGILLWHLISAAQPNINADIPNDALSFFVVLTARDNRQAVFSWAELDPSYNDSGILLLYTEDARFNLFVPNERSTGRNLEDVANISLRDAPRP